MKEIGVTAAKAQWAALLRRVALGERITITVRGRAAAMLVPCARHEAHRREEAAAELMQFGKGRRLRVSTIRRLVEQGRRR